MTSAVASTVETISVTDRDIDCIASETTITQSTKRSTPGTTSTKFIDVQPRTPVTPAVTTSSADSVILIKSTGGSSAGSLSRQNSGKEGSGTSTQSRHRSRASFGSIPSNPLLRDRASWVPDDDARGCWICEKEFGILRRRHHCRSCGQCICDACSPHKEVLAELGYRGKVRVCDNCHQSYFKDGNSRHGQGIDIEELIEKIEEFENKIEDLNNMLDVKNKEMEELKIDVRNAWSTNDAVEDRLMKEKARVKVAESRVAELRDELNNREEELCRLRTDNSDLEMQLKSLSLAMSMKTQQMELLLEKLRTADDKIKLKDDKIVDLMSRLKQAVSRDDDSNSNNNKNKKESRRRSNTTSKTPQQRVSQVKDRAEEDDDAATNFKELLQGGAACQGCSQS